MGGKQIKQSRDAESIQWMHEKPQKFISDKSTFRAILGPGGIKSEANGCTKALLIQPLDTPKMSRPAPTDETTTTKTTATMMMGMMMTITIMINNDEDEDDDDDDDDHHHDRR